MDVITVVLLIICSLLLTFVLYVGSYSENMAVEFFRTTISKHADAPIYDVLCSKKLAFYRVPVYVFLLALIPWAPHPVEHIFGIAGTIVLMYPMFIIIPPMILWCVREVARHVRGKFRGDAADKNAYEDAKSDNEIVESGTLMRDNATMMLNDDATEITVPLPTDANGNQLIRGDIVRYTNASGQECARVISNLLLVMDDYASTVPDMFGHAHWQLILGDDNVRASETHLTRRSR